MLKPPNSLQRNASRIRKYGIEETGKILLDYLSDLTESGSLENKDILDIGCGLRFSQAIVNLNYKVGSYTGIDVNNEVIAFLQQNTTSIDYLNYYHWNVYNDLYNQTGFLLNKEVQLPFGSKSFDIVCLFSVLTHLNPLDADVLLFVLKKHIRKNGYLVFSIFIDESTSYFSDADPDNPLLRAYYSKNLIFNLLKRNGWLINHFNKPRKDKFIQHHFVCQNK